MKKSDPNGGTPNVEKRKTAWILAQICFLAARHESAATTRAADTYFVIFFSRIPQGRYLQSQNRTCHFAVEGDEQ